jgi:hypothetical protein
MSVSKIGSSFLLMLCFSGGFALNEKTYNVTLEAPSTSSSIYGTFTVGGQSLKMTIGTNAGYVAVVSEGCTSCGDEI